MPLVSITIQKRLELVVGKIKVCDIYFDHNYVKKHNIMINAYQDAMDEFVKFNFSFKNIIKKFPKILYLTVQVGNQEIINEIEALFQEISDLQKKILKKKMILNLLLLIS